MNDTAGGPIASQANEMSISGALGLDASSASCLALSDRNPLSMFMYRWVTTPRKCCQFPLNDRGTNRWMYPSSWASAVGSLKRSGVWKR